MLVELTFCGTFSEFSPCVFLLVGETCSGFRLVAVVPAVCVKRPILSFSELLSASTTSKQKLLIFIYIPSAYEVWSGVWCLSLCPQGGPPISGRG